MTEHDAKEIIRLYKFNRRVAIASFVLVLAQFGMFIYNYMK